MTAQLIDGKALCRDPYAPRLARTDRACASAAGQPPGLAVVLVGDDPASAVYVRNKVKACEDVGIALGRRPAAGQHCAKPSCWRASPR